MIAASSATDWPLRPQYLVISAETAAQMPFFSQGAERQGREWGERRDGWCSEALWAKCWANCLKQPTALGYTRAAAKDHKTE